MAQRARRAACGGALAAALACFAAPAVAACGTIGPPDSEPSTGGGISCTGAGVCSVVQLDPGFTVPFDGVITRWRIWAINGGGSTRLRVVRGTGPAYTWVGGSATELSNTAGIHQFEAHVPVARGDRIGITLDHEI